MGAQLYSMKAGDDSEVRSPCHRELSGGPRMGNPRHPPTVAFWGGVILWRCGLLGVLECRLGFRHDGPMFLGAGP